MSSSDDPKNDKDAASRTEKDLESLGMDQLLEMYDESLQEYSEGDIVKGRILQVNPNEVIVDIGYKSEGLIPIEQVTGYDGNVTVKKGDEIEVYVERLDSPTGHVLLSRERAERMLVWDKLEEAFKSESVVTGRILDRIKGGLQVDLGGIRAFLPGSLVDVKPLKNLESLRGKESSFKIISFDKRRNNVVVSRRAVVEVEYEKKKKETFERLEEGKLTHGTVKNITEYGVFVDLGGVDGLLHITDISWGRVNHPTEYFNVGDEIEVIVLKFDPENERVSLGFKQRFPDPWLDVAERYPLGSKVHGKVVSLTDYGAFVELEEGVEGLIHISEMSWTRKVRPSKLLTVGESIEAVVADVNTDARRISLSLKALEENPWDTIPERFPIGSVIEGKVRNLTDFGAFVEVEEGIDGLVHISDMSWTRRLKHPSEVVRKGDVVKAKVINVDPAAQRLSLSMKEFVPNEWDEYAKDHKMGDEVVGQVSNIADFGLFIRLDEGVEGLAHISEIEHGAPLEAQYHQGDVLRARIIKLDWVEKKIGLSLRDVEAVSEEEREAFLRGNGDSPQPDGDDESSGAGDEAAGSEPAGDEATAAAAEPEDASPQTDGEETGETSSEPGDDEEGAGDKSE